VDADRKGRRVTEEIVKRACCAALQKAVTTKTHSDLIAAEVVPNIEGGPRQPSYPIPPRIDWPPKKYAAIVGDGV
jgi:hypothetical protein